MAADRKQLIELSRRRLVRNRCLVAASSVLWWLSDAWTFHRAVLGNAVHEPPACVDARVCLQELEKAIVDEQIRLSQACTDMGIKVWLRLDTVPILRSRPCSLAGGTGF